MESSSADVLEEIHKTDLESVDDVFALADWARFDCRAQTSARSMISRGY